MAFRHPRGLRTLFFTEMWERFSFNGMRALLLLYMVGSVQQPGLGFGAKQASMIYGLYTMAVFVSGIPGGWLADRWLGHYRAVWIGGAIIAAGHFTMVFEGLTFLYAGLVLIVIGTGLLKPSISTLVGALYEDAPERRDAGYSIFYMGINLGAFLAPLVCGWLGQKWNWHFGFAAAGVGMVFGLIQYVAGRRHLAIPSTTPSSLPSLPRNDAAADNGATQRVAVIFILSFFALLFWAAFSQTGTSLTLFADRATRLTVFGFTYPSSWFQSCEPLIVILFAPVFAWMWMRREISGAMKFVLGLALHAVAFAIIVPAALRFQANGARVSPMWLVALYVVQGFAELALSPVGLSVVAKLSPPRYAGLLMGVWFFACGMGNYVAGWFAGLLEQMTYARIFGIVAIAMAISAAVLAALAPGIKRLSEGRPGASGGRAHGPGPD
ncbi:MAG TPA: peptide MFS transporter [Thermoanaerobaculia bacterium]|nr:peptide MFS transporter [Thermoanaerobaculia bacterium]